MNGTAFIAIGRNEGERLIRCLYSLQKVTTNIIYVDSGSTDGSTEFAASLGATVVNLDAEEGFTMARGRNAGLKRLLALSPETEFVHFIDGDCELISEWLSAALTFITQHPDVAVVCGRRRERHPENSLYNRLCDIEWNTPIGETYACGGDALMRMQALKATGGFNEELIAGEEPELCSRMRQSGWKIVRMDYDMTLHDANILHLSEWWKRYVRGGYGACDVTTRLPDSELKRVFGSQIRSAVLWTAGSALILGLATLGSFMFRDGRILLSSFLCVLALWILQIFRTASFQYQRAGGLGSSMSYGLSLMVAKWPQFLGILKYRLDLVSRRKARLIEYK